MQVLAESVLVVELVSSGCMITGSQVQGLAEPVIVAELVSNGRVVTGLCVQVLTADIIVEELVNSMQWAYYHMVMDLSPC